MAFNPAIRLHTFPQTGRGLQTQTPLGEGAVVLEAGWDTAWTAAAAHAEPVLGRLLGDAGVGGDDALALFLLFVKLSPACARAADDARREHLRRGVPAAYAASAFFAAADLDAARGSTLHALTVRAAAQIADDYAALVRTVLAPHAAVFPLARFTLAEYTWALFTIWSRAMDFALPDGTRLRGIVPFLDMVNHSFDVKQCHAYDPVSRTVKILAGKNYASGDEIFINYGPVGNTKLLRLYGFIIPNNPYNAFDLVLSTSPLAPFFKEKSEIFANANIQVDSSFPLTLETPLPATVLQYLRIQRLEWTEINLVTSSTDKTKAGLSPFTARNEYEILSTLQDAFLSLLDGFAIKANNLEALIRENTDGKFKVGSNAWMAATVCLEEQRILEKSLLSVQNLLRGIVCGGGATDCGKCALGMKKCSRCNVTAYCGAECQKKDWPTHKLTCGNAK
ncbi:hypothetical protein BDR26DRAFT_912274 [Obelidium mucronatum]|nr:hypothetical protein BDR26DRAFT_912274 [Obelidium mucronatum]